MKAAAWLQGRCHQLHKFRLNQPPLVVPLLRPRVRVEKVDRPQAAIGNLIPNDIDCIVLDQTQVLNALPVCLQQAMPNPRFVDLDSQEIQVGILSSLRDQRITVAKADLQNARCLAAEQIFQIEWGRRIANAILRPELIEGAPLRCCHPAPTPHEAANRRRAP